MKVKTIIIDKRTHIQVRRAIWDDYYVHLFRRVPYRNCFGHLKHTWIEISWTFISTHKNFDELKRFLLDDYKESQEIKRQRVNLKRKLKL